jgi:Flp pilus assembly protein TadD
MKPAAQTVASNWATLLALSLVAVVAVGLYVNTLGNDFTNWDDGMIYSNYRIRSLDWDALQKIFTYWRGSTYQPVRELSYAIDYRFWKLNPLGYHITNILFYVLTCVMVFLTMRTLSSHLREGIQGSSHFRTALLGSLVFAAHPVHVEAVTWLAARKEVLQGFFFFTAFYLYLRGRETGGLNTGVFLGLSLLSILLATLSKSSAVVFPGVILVYELARSQGRWVDFVKRYWVFLGISVCISLLFTFIIIQVVWDAGGVKPYRGGSFWTNLLVSFFAFVHNIKLLVGTINYSASYAIDVPNPLFGLGTLCILGMTFLFFAVSFWSLRRRRVVFFSFLFFFVTLLPYLNIVPTSTILADRYLFIASFSYCFLLGVGFDRLCELRLAKCSEGFPKLLAMTLFLLLLVGYSLMTIRQNTIWQNSLTLWADAVEKSPRSNTANALMGVVYLDLGMDEEAVKYLERAVEILPYDYQSRNNLGIVYGRSGEPEKALREFAVAMWLKPEDDTIKFNLSIFYQRQKEYENAERVLKHLIDKNPKDATLYFRLGLVYRDMGKNEAAVSEFLKARDLAPRIVNIYEELGNIYLSRFNDSEKAKFYYTQGVEAIPNTNSSSEQLRWMVHDLEIHR